jgi:heme exporter protein D
MNWSEFFYMNGYAFYVWGSYGVAALVFAIEILMVRHRRQKALRELRLIRDELSDERTEELA